MQKGAQAVRTAILLAARGTVYRHEGGAACPLCGRRMRTVSSGTPGTGRIRRHRCGNPSCLVSLLALVVKSVEEAA